MTFSSNKSHDVKMARIIDLKFLCIPVVIVFVLFFFLELCHGQNVTFNVFNQRFGDAVFTGERDIVLRCCLGSFENGTIQIELRDGNVISNNGRTNYVEYKINEVQISDGGDYRCLANYTSTDDEYLSEKLHLYLNVPVNSSTPTCTRNGTYGEKYCPDDWLLLSCYCRSGDQCHWVSTVPESGYGTRLNNSNTYVYNGIKVLQVLINPRTSSNPTEARYDCSYNVSSTQRCSIGPEIESSNDVIINTAIVESGQCPAKATTTPNIDDGTTEHDSDAGRTTVGATNDVNNTPFDKFIIITVAIGVIAIILITLVVILIIVCRKGRLKVRNNDGDGKTSGFKNNAYSADDDRGTSPYYNEDSPLNTGSATTRDRSSNIATGKSAMGHLYDAPPLKGLETSEDDLSDALADDYAEIGDSRSRTRKQEMNLDPYNGEESSHRDSASGYTPVNRKEVPNNPAEDSDFGNLYAKVDKTKKGGS